VRSFEDIESFLESRKRFAIDCKTLFADQRDFAVYEDMYSGAVLACYVPSANISPGDLPKTLVSGPLTERNFWTDGAILVRNDRKAKATEVCIQVDRPLDSLLIPGLRVRGAFLLFHEFFHYKPHVLMYSERNLSVFDIRYIDFAVKSAKKSSNLKFFINEKDSGSLLIGISGVLAYISKIAVNALCLTKLKGLLEKHHALRRN
jgi:hypothetical protein